MNIKTILTFCGQSDTFIPALRTDVRVYIQLTPDADESNSRTPSASPIAVAPRAVQQQYLVFTGDYS